MVIVTQIGDLVNFNNVTDVNICKTYEGKYNMCAGFTFYDEDNESVGYQILGCYETREEADREIKGIAQAISKDWKVYTMSKRLEIENKRN